MTETQKPNGKDPSAQNGNIPKNGVEIISNVKRLQTDQLGRLIAEARQGFRLERAGDEVDLSETGAGIKNGAGRVIVTANESGIDGKPQRYLLDSGCLVNINMLNYMVGTGQGRPEEVVTTLDVEDTDTSLSVGSGWDFTATHGDLAVKTRLEQVTGVVVEFPTFHDLPTDETEWPMPDDSFVDVDYILNTQGFSPVAEYIETHRAQSTE